jgi:transcription initiation factor TFIIIB Brf1 subunit/transcription initiation factor TFIIB
MKKGSTYVCAFCKVELIIVGEYERNFWCPQCGTISTDEMPGIYQRPRKLESDETIKFEAPAEWDYTDYP